MNLYNNEFVQVFEDNWTTIYDEYLAVKNHMVDWPEHHLYNQGWEVFGLFDYPNGKEIVANTKLCPKTTELIKKYIPAHGTAGFSRLAANTIITPHTGYQGNCLRMHLGLEIPDGDCGLRVNNYIHHWQSGRVFIFDDKQQHDAWNNTASDRVILIVDFIKV
jgi:beta-hydroxylase